MTRSIIRINYQNRSITPVIFTFTKDFGWNSHHMDVFFPASAESESNEELRVQLLKNG